MIGKDSNIAVVDNWIPTFAINPKKLHSYKIEQE